MSMVFFLLSLLASLAATMLCIAWRRGRSHAADARGAAAALGPLTLLAAGLLLYADGILVTDERFMIATLAALTGMLWLFGFVRVMNDEGAPVRVIHDPGRTGAWWITLSAMLQGAFALTATWVAANNFLKRSPQMMGAWRWMWLTQLAVLLSGALYLTVVLAGALENVDDPAAENAGDAGEAGGKIHTKRTASRIPELVAAMLGAVVLRVLAMAGSIYAWAHFSPFGSRYFFSRLLLTGFGNFFMLRMILEFILPLLFGLLALYAWQSGARRQAAGQFVPVLLLVLISEMLAASLTVGLGGIAI